MLKVTLTRQQP